MLSIGAMRILFFQRERNLFASYLFIEPTYPQNRGSMKFCLGQKLFWFILFLSLHDTSTFKVKKWTVENLSLYDRIRELPPENVRAETHQQSNVISVNISDVTSRGSANASYRLCHIDSMLAVTIPGEHEEIRRHRISHRGAVLLAAVQFNNRIDTIVPEMITNPRVNNCDIKITVGFEDTRQSPIHAGHVLVNDVMSRNHSLESPLPCAIAGATNSHVTAALATLSSAQIIPSISFSSSSSLLDNKDKYGLFGRTVPTDKGYAIASLSYLWDVLGVTHCCILYEHTGWGNAFFTEITQAKTSMYPEMVVASVPFSIDSNLSALQEALNELKSTGYNYVFGLFRTTEYNKVMREAYRIGLAGANKFWLFPGSGPQIHASGYRYDAATDGDLVNATNGVGLVLFDFEENEGFDEAWEMLENDRAFKEYFISKQPEDISSSNFTFTSPSLWARLQFDAVMALGIAMCEARDVFFNGTSLYDAFRETSFRGATGVVAFDRKTGTRDINRIAYKAINVVENAPNARGEVTFSYNKVARQINSLTSHEDGTDYSMQWVETNPSTYADGGTIPPPVLPPKVWMETNMISLRVKAVGLALAAIVILISLVFMSWTVCFRNDTVVRVSQPEFLLMLCSGTILMGFSIIPQSMQEPYSQSSLNRSCMAAPWLFSLGFVVSFSALFSKTLRVKKLMDSSLRFRRIELKTQDVLLPFLVLLTCNTIVLGCWTILSPLVWQRTATGMYLDHYGRKVESYGRCFLQEGHSAVWFMSFMIIINVACLLYALYQSFGVRKLPTEYNISLYLTLSMASILQALVIGVPVLVIAVENPGAFFLTKALLISLICMATLLPMFVPKIRARKIDSERRELTRLLQLERKRGQELYTRRRFLKEQIKQVRMIQQQEISDRTN